ncbi:hypothetical protein [Fructilactobacillus frigidiflavus]
MKFYTSDQIELDYDDFGSPDDPAVMIFPVLVPIRNTGKKRLLR